MATELIVEVQSGVRRPTGACGASGGARAELSIVRDTSRFPLDAVEADIVLTAEEGTKLEWILERPARTLPKLAAILKR